MAAKFKPCIIVGCNGNAHSSAKGSRGWCQFHYNRWYWNSDPNSGRRTETGAPLTYVRNLLTSVEHNNCQIWPFAKNIDGYAVLQLQSKVRLVSRFVCQEIYGAAPSPQHVAAHSCGNGHLGCVNPKHLRWATPSENMQDAIRHGTWHGNTKFRGVREQRSIERRVGPRRP